MLLAMALACGGGDDDGRHPIPRDQRPPLEGAEEPDDTGAVDTAPTDSGDEPEDTAPRDSGPDEDDTDDDALAESCHQDIANWPEPWQALEEEVLELVNVVRARGADCGAYGSFGAAGPLEMDPYARCAARYHSMWMAETGTFAHESPGGDLGADFSSRMTNAGYRGGPYGENIAAGYSSARDVMAGWMASDGHCANIMAAYPTKIGVGYYQGGAYGAYWTQDFGY